MPPGGGSVTRQVSRVLPSDAGSVRWRVEAVRGALFKRIEEEQGVGWLGSGAQAGHSDSWNNRLRHFRQEEVIGRLLDHHAAQVRKARQRIRPAPAPGYRPESLDVLFGNGRW